MATANHGDAQRVDGPKVDVCTVTISVQINSLQKLTWTETIPRSVPLRELGQRCAVRVPVRENLVLFTDKETLADIDSSATPKQLGWPSLVHVRVFKAAYARSSRTDAKNEWEEGLLVEVASYVSQMSTE